MILSVESARTILADLGDELSDFEIEQLINHLEEACNRAYNCLYDEAVENDE